MNKLARIDDDDAYIRKDIDNEIVMFILVYSISGLIIAWENTNHSLS